MAKILKPKLVKCEKMTKTAAISPKLKKPKITKIVLAKLRADMKKLPADIKDEVIDIFKSMPWRHGAASFGHKFPDLAVTPRHNELMYLLRANGWSWRYIEAAMRLYPASGNDALRCVMKHETTLPKSKRTTTKARRALRGQRADEREDVGGYVYG